MKTKLLLLGATALTGMLAATGATAQTQVPAPEEAVVDEIVVTGSRIRRDPTNAPTPLIQLNREEILQSGEANVIDFLADIPALQSSQTPQDTTGSNLNDGGLSLANLRALGAGRTLTLVDGRRHVGSQPNTLAVDLDTIPRLLIESTEIITGGASSVYGADAVSGVLNFILRRDFEGLEIDGAYSQINQDGQANSRLSALYGVNLLDDRLNLYLSAEYEESDEVLDRDVDWRRRSCGFLSNDVDPAGVPDGVPNQILRCGLRTYIRGTDQGGILILATGTQPSPANDRDVPFQTCTTASFGAGCFSVEPANRPGNSFLFDENGQPRPVTFGPNRAQAGFSRVTSDGGEGQVLNTEQGQASRMGESRSARFQSGLNFQISDSLQVFGEVKYVDEFTFDAGQRAFQDFNIRAFQPGAVGAITATTAFEIGVDNAFLPASVRQAILTNRRDVFNSDGVRTGNVADPRAQFKLYGPARNQRNNRELMRYVVGLRGGVDQLAFVDNFDWEIGYTFGQVDNRNQETGVDIVRYQAAADAVVDTAGIVNGRPGEIVCRVRLLAAQGRPVPNAVVNVNGVPTTFSRQGDVINQCAPVRVFGPGGFTPEGLDYLVTSITVEDQNKQHDLVGFFRGDLWDFWGAGPIGFVLGGQYREEITSGVGRDRDTAGRLLQLNTGPDFEEASYDAREVFTEVSLPLFQDFWLGRSAEISGAYRYSDYSNIGGVDTYSLTLSYRPVSQLLLRTTSGTAVRVPNLGETNDPPSQTFANNFSDPCNANVINNASDPGVRANRIANCSILARGFGLDLVFDNPGAANAYIPNYGSGSVPGFNAGNMMLRPETSESFTVGGVWTPDLIPGLAMSLDYYEIEIKDAITSISAANAAAQCVSGQTINTAACATVTRDPTSFLVTTFIQGSLNFASLTAKGIDFDVRYRGELGQRFGRDLGRWSYSMRGNWLLERNNFVNFDDPTDATVLAGDVGQPRVRFLQTISWMPTDRLALTWDWDWQASQDIVSREALVANRDLFETPKYAQTGDYSTHDFSVRYDLREDVTLRAGVINAFDADPVPWLGNTSADNFDLFGRRFYVGFNFRPF